MRKLLLLVLVTTAVMGCDDTHTAKRVIVLGFDGADPRAVNLLMSEGKLPNFARLRQEGAYAPLTTGATPDPHAKALWNLFSDAARRVAVVGWRATWPAGDGAAAGLTYPPALADALAPEIRRAVSSADAYRAIGLRLWHDERPDLLMVYIEATDAPEQRYVRADAILGEYMAAMDGDTALVVLSDHTPSGVLYLYGSGVARHARISEPTNLDVVPTVLALAGLPPAADVPGRVLAEVLAAPAAAPVPRPDNVAAELFQQGRLEDAAAAYAKIVEREPNDGAARASLAGVLGALGRYEEALTQLSEAERLDPRNPETYHNRGAIHEKRGEKEAALRAYRTALRYSPQYQPSRAALARLTGSDASPSSPANESERRAYALAEEAGVAARRGDYAAALRKLDEAEAIAPRYVLVYQYRSNVAYLMGDRAGAIAALKKALALEPDNALFRSNLQSIETLPPR